VLAREEGAICHARVGHATRALAPSVKRGFSVLRGMSGPRARPAEPRPWDPPTRAGLLRGNCGVHKPLIALPLTDGTITVSLGRKPGHIGSAAARASILATAVTAHRISVIGQRSDIRILLQTPRV